MNIKQIKDDNVADGIPLTFVERYPWEALEYDWVLPEHKIQAKKSVQALEGKKRSDYTRKSISSHQPHVSNCMLSQDTGKEQYIVAMREHWLKQLDERPGNATVPAKSAKDPKPVQTRKAGKAPQRIGISGHSEDESIPKPVQPRKTGTTPQRIDFSGHSDNEVAHAERRGVESVLMVQGHDSEVSKTYTRLPNNKRSTSSARTSNTVASGSILLNPLLHRSQSSKPQISSTPRGTSEATTPELPSPSAVETSETVELIALHLACTPNFHQLMRSDGQLSMRPLDKHWLCSLNLPERSMPEYTEDTAWLAHYNGRRYEKDIKKRATEIFRTLPKRYQKPLEKPVKGPVPVANAHWVAIREDLFRYHEMHWDLLDTEKRIDELRNVMLNAPAQQHSKRMLAMENAEKECLIALLGTTLERTVAREIDVLLSAVPESFSPTVYQGSRLRLHEEAINKVMELHDVDFGQLHKGSEFRSVNSNYFSKAADLSDHKYPITCTPLSGTLSAHGSFQDHDKRLTAEVPFVFEEINRQLFETNFHAFMGVSERMDHLKAMVPCESRDLDSPDLLHDNLAHARLYFDELKAISDDGLDQSPLDDIWRRLVAIIALCYRCTSEPAFFLSTLDRQLSELRAAVGKFPFVHI
jgi:hypothetical protein